MTATGPRPIVRRDGSTTYSSGAVHTGLIRLADRLKRQPKPADQSTVPSNGYGDIIARLADQERYEQALADH